MKNAGKYIACMIGVGLVCSTAFGSCGFGGARSDDEIYAALADATEKLVDYNDELTIDMQCIMEQPEKETETVSVTYSLNPKKGIMYCLLTSKDTDATIKVFEEDREFYIMSHVKTKQEENGVTETHETVKYNSLSVENVDFLTSMQSFSILSGQDLDLIFQEYQFSFSALQDAYANVYNEQVAERRETDPDASAKYKLTTDRGINTIRFESYSEIKKGDKDLNGNSGIYTQTTTSKVVGKKGNISQVKAESELSFEKHNSNLDQVKQKAVIQIDIAYSFNKKGYKKIETELPDTVEPYESTKIHTKKFKICGMTTERTVISESFNPYEIFMDMKQGFEQTGCTVEWYLDSAYTQPFTPQQLTYEQFCDVECVYGKVTVNDEYAVIARDYRIQDKRTEAYKAVFGPILEPAFNYETLEAKKIWGLSHSLTNFVNVNLETAVNGVIYRDVSMGLILEAGKLYLITYTQGIDNTMYSIFDMDVSSLWPDTRIVS